MKKILLNTIVKTKNYKKYSALVDDEDYEKVNQYNWFAQKSKNTFYAITYIEDKRTIMHTFITGYKLTDHINRNGLDNRKCNLREVTHQQNCMNRASIKNSSSKFKGVSRYKAKNKWMASIALNAKSLHIGYFVSEIDAARAYNKKAKELFGEFANLNEI